MADAGTGSGTVVVVSSETMGRGDDALGARLLGNFMRALATTAARPDAVVFYNAAVRLLTPQSVHLDALRALEEAGVDLLACVTCLEYFSLTDQLAVGTVSNMREIVQRSMAASKVMTV
jgi:selenium metabolism protein YedF